MAKTRMQDIVVILPGMTGSVLQKDGKDIWAVSGQAVWQAFSTLGDSLQQLKLDRDDPDVEELGDGIKATQLIEDTHLIPGLVKIDGYSAISHSITDFFDVKDGQFFKFPYDWRRDNRANARLLNKFLDRRLRQWRESSGAEDAKVILIAHSMGGLICRYYLEVLEGWRDCKALFTFGTPFRGSVKAVDFLANGYKNLFFDLTEVLRSLPSVYQLLPIYEMLKVDQQYHRIAETANLPNIVQQRALDALNFHRDIENAVNSHKGDEEYQKSYKTIPMVGIKQPTMQSASLVAGKLTVSSELPEWLDPLLGDGDGTVPYLSAIPIEQSDDHKGTYTPERHSSIQNHGQVLDDLCNRIKAMQVRGLKEIRDPGISDVSAGTAAISLDLDDLYLADEAVEIRAKLVDSSDDFGKLKARIKLVSGDDSSVRADFQEQNGQWVLHLDKLNRGLYRLEVRAEKNNPRAPMPVHDLFEVIQ